MLGDHGGISPLTPDDEVAKVILRAFARLKAGKDVRQRQQSIQRALAALEPGDRHWPESLASKLAAEDGIEAIPAHLGALAAAWACREDEIARHIRSVNTLERDSFSTQAVLGLMSAAPEFGERMKAMRVNSDEVFLRVALAHFFRRDPSSSFAMFVIDGVVRQLSKALKADVGSFVQSCLERFDEEAAPEDAWGYVVVLRDMTGRSGFYLFPPTEESRGELQRLRSKLETVLGPLEDEAFYNHVAGAAMSGYLFRGDMHGFAGLISALADEMRERFLVLYGREVDGPEGGINTQVLRIPASTVDEARRIVGRMPEVHMHDGFRVLTEFLEQQEDLDAMTKP